MSQSLFLPFPCGLLFMWVYSIVFRLLWEIHTCKCMISCLRGDAIYIYEFLQVLCGHWVPSSLSLSFLYCPLLQMTDTFILTGSQTGDLAEVHLLPEDEALHLTSNTLKPWSLWLPDLPWLRTWSHVQLRSDYLELSYSIFLQPFICLKHPPKQYARNSQLESLLHFLCKCHQWN